MCIFWQRHCLFRVALLVSTWTACIYAHSQEVTAEESRFEAARAQTEPEARAQSLQEFLKEFPTGSRRATAQNLLLETYLADFPDRTGQIHALASAQIIAATAGFDRWTEEARLAGLLANTGDLGVDLKDAQIWAEDAVASLNEDSYRREMTVAQIRYKLPRMPPRQLHAQYLEYRASFLTALASVDLRQNKPEVAAPLLQEALRLQPLSGDAYALSGELALARGNTVSALVSLERADAMGHLSQRWRRREVELYATQQHGDAAALDRQIDEVYRTMYPPAFSLPRRQLASGGHTALLELFTGSGCIPCAAPDLAIDSLLGSYTRQDLIVLAYDEHIPRPDPLTAPDGITRAATYAVASTPEAFLDGQPLDVLGASRADVENVVVGFAEPVEEVAALPSGLKLNLTAERAAQGEIEAKPALAVNPLPPTAKVTTGDVSLRKLAQAVLYVALVQDDIRYSGENGIRFHRMVVRSMQQFPAAAYLGNGSAVPVRFDPAGLDRAQLAYLSSFEKTNDRFGAFHFSTTDLPIEGGDLDVVAWVQDPETKQVLQSAYAPVPAR